MSVTTVNQNTRYSILIVDDDDDVRVALQDELEMDYDVTAVATGKAALGHLEQTHFDAIISDQRMPGMSGVQVLEEALQRDANLIRILLTGYVDDDARRATMEENAPYKIGKPWHDEVEVTLKRAFENRSRERTLSCSVADALAIAGIDDELATVASLSVLAKLLVRRTLCLQGVEACQVLLSQGEEMQTLAGTPVNNDSTEWKMDCVASSDGQVRLLAWGNGGVGQDIITHIAQRARHWSGQDNATRLAKKAHSDPLAKERLSAVSRQATLGTMTVALVHELASMVQSLQGALYELEDFVQVTAHREDDLEVVDTLEHAVETSARMVALFRSMRTFVRSGDSTRRPCPVAVLVERSVALCQGALRSVVELELSDIPDIEIEVNEALFLQVLVNLLRNAVEASPHNSVINFDVSVQDNQLVFSVRDHGPGVPEEFISQLFEPFTSTKNDHSASGLGLAISWEIVADHGGTLKYRAAEDGGAIFTVSLPLPEQ